MSRGPYLDRPPIIRNDGRFELVRDAVMEESISQAVIKCIQEGEKMENIATELEANCCCYNQLTNMYADWLEELGDLIEVERSPTPEVQETKKKTKKGKHKERKKKNKETNEEEPEPDSTAEPTTPTAAPLNKALTVRTSFSGEKGAAEKKHVWSTWNWLQAAQGKDGRDSGGILSPSTRRDSQGPFSPTTKKDSSTGVLSPIEGKTPRRRTFSKSETDVENEHPVIKKEDSIDAIFDGKAEAEKSIELTLSGIARKNFDQNIADALFSGGGGIDWLPEIIKHKQWRVLLYDLIEIYPNCLMLNFAVKLISDAGYQDEISNASTNLACGQLDIFTKVFVSTFDKVLREHRHGCRTIAYEKAFGYLVSIVCQNEHTYILVQCALAHLYKTQKGRQRAACRHVAEELRASLKHLDFESHALMYSLLLDDEYIPDEIITSLLNMVSKSELNPADIRHIYDDFITPHPTNVDIIRDFSLIDLLIDSLFHCEGPKATIEHRDMYIYLLAYISSVNEITKDSKYRSANRADFQMTREAISTAVTILETTEDLGKELNILDLTVRPVVAMGLLYYVHTMLLSENTLGELPLICLCFLDQIATRHRKLRGKIFKICQELFSKVSNSQEAAEIIMDRQKLILDRLIHLFSEGEVAYILEKVASWFSEGDIDVSLVRYFVIEILEIIMPPYSDLLKDCLLPLVSDSDVFDENSRLFPNVMNFLRECGKTEDDEYVPIAKKKKAAKK